MKTNFVIPTLLALAASASLGLAATGNFTGPLTDAILSVDLNGGQNSANGATTEGWGTSGPIGPDSYGVTWSPWGGPTSTGGDGTQLPNSSAGVTGTSISKTFGAVTATLSLNANNINFYTSHTLDSRDRGTNLGTWYHAGNDGDMFRDFILVGAAGGIQGEDYLALSFSGLTAGNSYTIAVYSFDAQNTLTVNWTATAPNPAFNGSYASWGTNNNFVAPADEQTITWTGGSPSTTPAPAVFTLTANNSGVITLYGYGGDGISGHESSGPSYLNGFQIAGVTGGGGGGGGTNGLQLLPVPNTNINAGVYLVITNVVAGSSSGPGGGGGTPTVIGSWQNSTDEGWIDWGNKLSITDAANAGIYSFVSGAVSGYAQSLQIAEAGYQQNLAIKLENVPGGVAAFLTNHFLSFTFSVPSAASSGSTAGFSQVYALSINATGYGFVDQPFANFTATGDTSNNQGGQPNFYFYNGAPAQSQTVKVDYSSILSSITATPSSGYVELVFSFNNGSGGATNYFINNVVLSQ